MPTDFIEENEILDFTYRPKTKVREARLVMFGALIIAALLVIASVISPKYKGVISLFAVVALIVVVFVFTRYLSAQYAYAVMTTAQGENMLIVTKTVGKNMTTLAMIRLYEIVSVESLVDQRQKTPERDERKFNFCPSMKPDEIFVMRTRGRYERRLILLEINEACAARLLNYAKIAKENEPDE